MEESLLLFSPQFPSWDKEAFQLADKDPAILEELQRQGFVRFQDQAYVLTPQGDQRRLQIAMELGCPAFALGNFDPERALWRNKFYLLFDKAFLGRWSVKEFSCGETLPVVPHLQGPELYQLDKAGQIRYTWPDHPLIHSFLETFPNWGVASRAIAAPGEAGLEKWIADHHVPRGSFTWDLVFRSRYDFALYRRFPPIETDRFRCQNADRAFCLFCSDEDPRRVYDALGKLHLFILALRRIYIPGYADFDSQDQENQNLMMVVTDKEKNLEGLSKKLRAQGKALIDPAKPLFLIGTSLERLRAQQSPTETYYDWFCDNSLHILRPDED